MRVIITADDYGMSKSTNNTIQKGIELGVISSTNVMINMPFCDNAKSLPCNMGIHLNLTAGKPITKNEEIPTLVDSSGNFYSYQVFKKKLQMGKISHAEIKKEIYAQIDEYRNRIGEPSYWNTHNHVHMLPSVFKTFVDATSEKQLFFMRNNYKCMMGGAKAPLIKNILIGCFYRYARYKKMRYPSGIAAYAKSADKLDINTYYATEFAETMIVELIFHVADNVDSEFFGNLKKQRIDEKDFVFGEKFRDYIDTVEICTFGDI